MNTATKWVIGLVVVVLVILGIVSSQKNKNKQDSSNTAATTQNGPIKIGVLGPYTGDAAVYGEVLRNVNQITFDEINKAGGINGQQIEAIYEDGKCNGKDAASATQKLANVDKVQIIMGYFCSSEALASVPVGKEAKVAMFSIGASSPDLTNIDPLFARDYPSDASQGVLMADFSKKQNYKLVAVMQEQTPYAQGIYKVYNEKFTAAGGKTVKEEFPSTATDFRSQLAKLKAQNPDVLYLVNQDAPVAQRILKQLKEMGWKPQIFLNDAIIGDPDILAQNADQLEGAYGAEFGVDLNNSKFSHIVSAYKDKYGKEPSYLSYVQTVYDAPFILKDAIMSVGYDGPKIADYLHHVNNWQGASGSVTIGADGDRVGGHRLEIVKGGKTVPVQ